MDTAKIGQPLYNGQTSWNGMNECTIHVIVKQSQRNEHLSTTDKSHAPQYVRYSKTQLYLL